MPPKPTPPNRKPPKPSPPRPSKPRTRGAALAVITALLAAWGITGITVSDDKAIPPAPSVTAAPIVPLHTHPVDRVVDGDTVRIDRDGKSVTLRLIGGDTPETVHPSKPVECYGPEASREAKRLLDGETVTVIYDPTQGTPTHDDRRVDYYQRDLVYIELPDGTDFMEHMIREGFATENTYRGQSYERQAAYQAAEDEAQAADAGLWAAC